MKRHLRPWYSWVRKRVRDSTCVLPSLHPSLILVFHHPHCVWKTQSSQAARVSWLGDLGVIPLPSLCSPCGHFLHALFSRPLALMKRWPLAFSDRAGITQNLLSSLDVSENNCSEWHEEEEGKGKESGVECMAQEVFGEGRKDEGLISAKGRLTLWKMATRYRHLWKNRIFSAHLWH